jgi:membrane associated rhomboid family serine protease/Zn-finger nucleic acid-binding protein
MLCPHCRQGLLRTSMGSGVGWGCPACGGRAVTMPVLRRMLARATVNELWRPVGDDRAEPPVPCPSCEHGMQRATASDGVRPHQLELCRLCHLVWFDGRELEALPRAPAPVPELSPPAREALARADAAALLARTEPAAPDLETLQGQLALLGLPLELRPEALRRLPLLTWSVAALVAAVSVWGFVDEAVVRALGFLPKDAFRAGGATLLTAFFVHGSVWHLLSNLYFLVVFGDDVEDLMGRSAWLWLVGLSTLAGSLLHLAAEPRGTVLTVGASAGISGLLSFYALRWPHRRLGTRLGLRFGLRWVTFSARAGFLFWLAMQALVVVQQLSGFGNVSGLAHLGGVSVGAAAWYAWGRWT